MTGAKTIPAAISIEPIRIEHVASFRAALDSVCRERRYLTFLEAPAEEECRAFVAANIRHGHPQLVALDDGKVVGWCDVVPVDRPICAHGGVLGMGVVRELRGKGIGGGLLRATLAAARAAGLSRVELSVRAGNAVARRLYERFGFVVEGVKRDAIRLDGASEDLVSMALLFDGEELPGG